MATGHRLLQASASAAVICALAVSVSSCSSRREYVVPEIPLPKQYRQSSPQSAVRALRPPPTAPAAEADAALEANVRFADEMLAEWWHILGSRELDALLDQALANNGDLRVATLRMAQARARAEQAGADELPLVTAPLEARAEAPVGGVGSVLPGGRVSSRRLYQGALRGDWRLDIWGERQALTESAQLQLWRAIYQRDDARRQLAASAVSQYVEYLSLNDRLQVARETELVLRGMLDAVAGRLTGGDATITELEQQRAAVYAVQATIPALELQRENAINGLALLLGAAPGSLALSQRGLDSLAFPRVLPGVPANLMLRRPDVRAIEARLLSADADIEVARARLLPAIDLSAQVGYGGVTLSRLFQSSNLAWNVIAGLSAVIFDAGRRSNEVAYAQAVHEEMVETYVRTLYTAIRETEDAIASVQMNARRLEFQGEATRAAKRAWDLSMEAYGEGAIDYLTLLDTERTYHRNLDEYHRVALERHKGLVALFAALGGGVPRNTAAPARGAPPAQALEDPNRRHTGMRGPQHFEPHVVDPERRYWLAELGGLQDRQGVVHVWRDMLNRFPDAMAERSVLVRLQGSVVSGAIERAAWYRLYVASFSSEKAAEDFCGRLAAGLVRCRIVASDSAALRNDGPSDSPLLEAFRPRERLHAAPLSAVAPVAVAVAPAPFMSRRTPEPKPKSGNEASPRQAAVETPHPAASPAPTAPTPAPARLGYAVQLATTRTEKAAHEAAREWAGKGYHPYLYPVVRSDGEVLYTVRTGLFPVQAQAAARAASIRRSEQLLVVTVPVALDEMGQPAPAVRPRLAATIDP